jgi:hypothetical protein
VTHGAYPRGSVPGRQGEPDVRRRSLRAPLTERAGPENYGSEFQDFLKLRQLEALDELDESPEFSGWASAGQHAAPRPEGPRLEDLGSRLLVLLREHRLFCSLLTVAAALRIIAMLGYPPALWYPDSLEYVEHAVHIYPDPIRSNGYPFLLALLEPFHSVGLVAAAQHAMGLAIGVAVYSLLWYRYKLPKWACALAAVPPLFSMYAIQIEHFILSDTAFAFLITAAVFLILWRPEPTLWTCGLVGLLLSVASLIRAQGLALVLAFVIYLLTRLGRRRLISVLLLIAAFALPLGVYASWFDSQNKSFELTTSTGAFLYGRVATFADCSVISPPANERWLCPSTPVSNRQDPTYYVWGSNSPLSHGPQAEFSSKVNSLSTGFALRAIEAQPVAYLGTVWHSTFLAFAFHRDATPEGQSQALYLFPSAPASVASQAVGCGIPLCTQAVDHYNGGSADTRMVQPFAGFIRLYQSFAVLPGPLLGLIALAGLAGVLLAWRRDKSALLPWLVGVMIIVVPAATAEFDARYVVASVPLLCIAGALGGRAIIVASRRRFHTAAGSDAAFFG